MIIYDFEDKQIYNFDGYYHLEIEESWITTIKIFPNIDSNFHHSFKTTRPARDVMKDFAEMTEFWLTKDIKVVP